MIMDEKKKSEFLLPEATFLYFEEDDVITLSSENVLYWGRNDEENF